MREHPGSLLELRGAPIRYILNKLKEIDLENGFGPSMAEAILFFVKTSLFKRPAKFSKKLCKFCAKCREFSRGTKEGSSVRIFLSTATQKVQENPDLFINGFGYTDALAKMETMVLWSWSMQNSSPDGRKVGIGFAKQTRVCLGNSC